MAGAFLRAADAAPGIWIALALPGFLYAGYVDIFPAAAATRRRADTGEATSTLAVLVY